MFSWAELNTHDAESAWKLYSEIFGWQERGVMNMGPAGDYRMFQDPAESTKGGMSNMAKQMSMPPHWLHYVTVGDMDAAIERIKQNGGKVGRRRTRSRSSAARGRWRSRKPA